MKHEALLACEKLLEAHPNLSQDDIRKIKVQFIKFNCFNIVANDETTANLNQVNELLIREFKVVREVLESGLLLAVANESILDFDRAQKEVLGIYFNDFVVANIPPSTRQALIVSTILLWHLVNDSLEQFHLMVHRMTGIGQTTSEFNKSQSTEVSFFGVPVSQMSEQDRALLDYPVILERDILDGNISRILASVLEGIPSVYFEWFAKQLTHTLRNRMAMSIESAYPKISIEKLKTLLGFSNQAEVLAFVDNIRSEKERLMAGLAATRNTQDIFAVKWVCPDTPSEVPDRPSTPTSLPKAGEGKVFANLARTSTSSLGSRAFSLTKQGSTEHAPAIPQPSQPHQSIGTTTDGPFRLDGNRQGNQLWLLSHDKEQITFKQLIKSKPLIPAHELMRNWIGYAMDLECSV